MTDIELLPLPESDGFMENFDTHGCVLGTEDAWGEQGLQDYARANVEYHTDKLLEALSRLREQNNRLARELIACVKQLEETT